MTTVRLAIESATDRLSVAALRGGEGPLSAIVPGARQHASAMLLLIEQVLRPLGAGPADLALVAVSDGPGSFTGLRVGVAVAKALAIGAGIPLWTAPSLLLRAAGTGRPGETIMAISPALRGEAYAGTWRFEKDGRITGLVAPRPVGVGDLGALPEADRIVGEGPDVLVEQLSRRWGVPVEGGPAGEPKAEVLLALVDRPGGAYLIEDAASWEPFYGRPAEAQARWEREHGRPLPDSSDTDN